MSRRSPLGNVPGIPMARGKADVVTHGLLERRVGEVQELRGRGERHRPIRVSGWDRENGGLTRIEDEAMSLRMGGGGVPIVVFDAAGGGRSSNRRDPLPL